jgi:transcriptional regulator with XRE-family HTH domain
MATTVDTPTVLRDLMRDQGYANPQDLAAASGMPYNTLYRWSTGKSNPHRRSLIGLFEKLGVDPAKYGITSPGPAVAPAQTPPGDRDFGPLIAKLQAMADRADDTYVRVKDVPVMMARMELMARDIAAIREHLGIQIPTAASS